jgi:DNA-binding CsgD family transcriptional regulator
VVAPGGDERARERNRRRWVSAPAPANLRAARFTVAGKEIAVLSYPLPPADLPKSLTKAEREVALAIFAGRSNAEIAVQRGTSPRTIANQVASLFAKLGLRSRNELAALVSQVRDS